MPHLLRLQDSDLNRAKACWKEAWLSVKPQWERLKVSFPEPGTDSEGLVVQVEGMVEVDSRSQHRIKTHTWPCMPTEIVSCLQSACKMTFSRQQGLQCLLRLWGDGFMKVGWEPEDQLWGCLFPEHTNWHVCRGSQNSTVGHWMSEVQCFAQMSLVLWASWTGIGGFNVGLGDMASNQYHD